MKKVYFTNISYPGNAGDFYSSPLFYYDFSNYDFEQIHFMYIWDALEGRERDYYLIKDSIVVIGGGGLITHEGDHLQKTVEYLVENNKVIFWGAGTNTLYKSKIEILNHPNVILSGIRDFSFENYLPCVSCKNIYLDKNYKELGGIGILESAGLPTNFDLKIPRISNDRPIEEILEFIGGKSIIISATFHGLYWSQLLSKKVLYYPYNDNINSKYINIKHRVPSCNEKNYLDKIYNLSHVEGFKEECRMLNDNFYKEVLKLL